jgi:hypothetical protein
MESVHEKFVSINGTNIKKIILLEEIGITTHIIVHVYIPSQLKHQGCTELLRQCLESGLAKLVYKHVIYISILLYFRNTFPPIDADHK